MTATLEHAHPAITQAAARLAREAHRLQDAASGVMARRRAAAAHLADTATVPVIGTTGGKTL